MNSIFVSKNYLSHTLNKSMKKITLDLVQSKESGFSNFWKTCGKPVALLLKKKGKNAVFNEIKEKI